MTDFTFKCHFWFIWENQRNRGLTLTVALCGYKHTIHKFEYESNPGEGRRMERRVGRIPGGGLMCYGAQSVAALTKNVAQGRLQRVYLHLNGTVPNLRCQRRRCTSAFTYH